MRLKSFYAKTMTEAMQMVRETLGEDAIIVATREERGGKSVSVTAAIDEPYFAQPTFDVRSSRTKSTTTDWLQYDDEQETDSQCSEILMDVLLKHGVPEDVLDQIVSCAMVLDTNDPHTSLVGAIETLFSFQPLAPRPQLKALMMVGTPGAGKTLAVAKQATRCVMNNLSVAVITTDIIRAGGIEQLKAFTDILGLDLHKAKNPNDLTKKLSALPKVDQIIIDTPGINPFDTNHMKELARLIVAADIEPVLVIPAGVDAAESGDIARLFAGLGVRRIISSRIDIARRIGGLLTAAHQGRMIFADCSDTGQVANGLTPLTADMLARALLKIRQSASMKTTNVQSSPQQPQKQSSGTKSIKHTR